MFRSSVLNFFFSLGFAVLFLGVLPLFDLTSWVALRVSDDEELVAELRELQQRKDQLLKQYRSVSEDNIRKLEAVIPSAATSFDVSVIYFFFETLGRENGLRIENLTIHKEGDIKSGAGSRRPLAQPSFAQPESGPSEEAPIEESGHPAIAALRGSAVKTISVSIKGSGTYGAFKAFLRSVEGSLRLIDVVSYDIQGSKGDETAELSYSIELTMYHQ